MRKKTFFALSALLFALCFSANAQQAKVAKIGELIFRGRDRPGLGAGREVFRAKLRELGYIEGKNIVFETRFADSKLDRFPALADELVRLRVDILVASSTSEVLALKRATQTIPIVFFVSSDPVADQLVDSLPRPGGNITGVTSIGAVLAGKRLELLKETIPKLSRVALLWNPQDGGSVQQWKESQFSARELGLQLHSMEVSSAEKFESEFKEAIKAGSTALAVAGSQLYSTNPKPIAELAAKNRLPTIFYRREYIENGGLMAYGPDRAEPYKRVASIVDKILKGAKPAELPVEQPTKFELAINLKVAKALGLTIPPVLLMRADRVIR